jgi:hypothetical protein
MAQLQILAGRLAGGQQYPADADGCKLCRSPPVRASFGWRTNGEYATIPAVPRSVCSVSFKDERGIRHTVEVEAESLFEAAILAVRAFRKAEWITNVGPAMPLDIEVRAPVTRHTITLIQVQRWLDGSVNSPNEMVKKAKLKELLTGP